MTPRYLEQLSDILNSVTQNEQQLHCVLVLLNLSMQSLDTVTSELVDSITILREQVFTLHVLHIDLCTLHCLVATCAPKILCISCFQTTKHCYVLRCGRSYQVITVKLS